ncbi:MAG TPA: DnaJ domain-containing protein [Anaeromyxobacter sp.]|nr:DnaJ domain-containing protein [Anaeromyxobacter sp.]
MPGATYGMAAREVSPEAAIAAGLPLNGSLAQASTLRLFALAAAAQAGGELTVSTEGRAVTYMLFFRRGAVEHAGSSDPADDLERFLVGKGVLTPERLALSQAGRPAAGGDLVAALIAAKLVNPADVAGLLLEHGASLVTKALACEAGSFSWEPGVPPPPSSFPLGSPFAALCAAVRALDVAAVKRRLGDRERGPATRIVGRIRLEDLRLTPQEARGIGYFDGARSPAEIAAAQPAEAGVVLRLALLLGEAELLAFGPPRAPGSAPPRPAERPPAGPAAGSPPSPSTAPQPAAPQEPAVPPAPAARPAPTPRPAPPPKPPAPARPAAAPTASPSAAVVPLDLAVLRTVLEKQKGADHFQVLGVKRDAAAAAIKAAYFQLARSYHPDAVPPDAPPEAKKLCADVFARLSEAWAVLGDEGRRVEYLEELKSGGAADVDVMRILHAETVFQEATVLVKARRYDDAMTKLGEALQLNPEEPEFAIWKAWCEFLLAADKKRQHPMSAAAIEAALKKNAKCAPGYQFLAQMAKLVGELNLAEKHLKRGLQAIPDQQDLARELKYLRR